MEVSLAVRPDVSVTVTVTVTLPTSPQLNRPWSMTEDAIAQLSSLEEITSPAEAVARPVEFSTRVSAATGETVGTRLSEIVTVTTLLVDSPDALVEVTSTALLPICVQSKSDWLMLTVGLPQASSEEIRTSSTLSSKTPDAFSEAANVSCTVSEGLVALLITTVVTRLTLFPAESVAVTRTALLPR